MAQKTRKPKASSPPATGEAEPVPGTEEASPDEAPQEPDGARVESLAIEPDTYAEHLESAGEMEEAHAEIVETGADSQLQTPAGMQAAIEALLFASPEPLTVRRICNALGLSDAKLVGATLERLRLDCNEAQRGVQIQETAEGFQMATREAFGDYILRLRGRKRRPPLSSAALETLAIIAYRQPLIRAEIEAIRGVESSGTLRNLLDLNLIEVVGHREVLGRPRMYGTTTTFLQAFGLRDLDELPPIAELKNALMQAEAAEAEAAAERARAAAADEEETRQPPLPDDAQIPVADEIDTNAPQASGDDEDDGEEDLDGDEWDDDLADDFDDDEDGAQDADVDELYEDDDSDDDDFDSDDFADDDDDDDDDDHDDDDDDDDDDDERP